MNNNILEEYVLNIIQNNKIKEQSELQVLLSNKGFNIPQATLSRKLKKLKVIKVDGIYKVMEFNKQALPVILKLQISDLGLIVLHTTPGQASGLAYFLDQKYVMPIISGSNNGLGIIGTIAGDDTILLILKNRENLANVLELLYKLFPYLK